MGELTVLVIENGKTYIRMHGIGMVAARDRVSRHAAHHDNTRNDQAQNRTERR